MSGRGRKPEEPKQGAPAYIVTFSDMITLLLTFFVLLLSLAETQDEGLFAKGQDSFRRAIAQFGMSGILFSKDPGNEFEHPKIKYKIDKGQDASEDRSIDSATEVFRRILQDIERMMKISPSQITCTSKTFSVTDITFEQGSWALNDAAKGFLANYIRQIRASFINESPTFYVVGLTGSEQTEKQRWIVSARRAQAVADYIEKLAAKEEKWPVYSWGAGAGGDWTSQTGVLSKQTNIMIAVLTDEK